MVLMEPPPQDFTSKQEIIDYYVNTLCKALASEKDAQMCIYNASWEAHFGFCCEIDQQISSQLPSLPGVLSVMPDPDLIRNYNLKPTCCCSLLGIQSIGLLELINRWLVLIRRLSLSIIMFKY
ncbi:chloroplast mRNA modification [Stylosanthes scabra]|uniref:Chloroplast mRNA modification n=1 Tax=Stylosanthes scabra TaxID=79078 RepID=A0ABU6UGC1_9FABA|nr:chloroplast mRNA modification [Stylosanthes scabra]